MYNQKNLNLKEVNNLDKFSIDTVNINSKFKSNKSNHNFLILNKGDDKDNMKINSIYIPNDTSLNLPISEINSKSENKESKDMKRNIIKTLFRTQYIRKSLFPFKYYLCSIFIKSGNDSKLEHPRNISLMSSILLVFQLEISG